MDIIEWLDMQIENSVYHPDMKQNYLIIINDYATYKEKNNGKAEIEELDSRGDQETGSIAQTIRSSAGQTDSNPKAKRGRKKGWKVGSKGKIGEDIKEDEVNI